MFVAGTMTMIFGSLMMLIASSAVPTRTEPRPGSMSPARFDELLVNTSLLELQSGVNHRVAEDRSSLQSSAADLEAVPDAAEVFENEELHCKADTSAEHLVDGDTNPLARIMCLQKLYAESPECQDPDSFQTLDTIADHPERVPELTEYDGPNAINRFVRGSLRGSAWGLYDLCSPAETASFLIREGGISCNNVDVAEKAVRFAMEQELAGTEDEAREMIETEKKTSLAVRTAKSLEAQTAAGKSLHGSEGRGDPVFREQLRQVEERQANMVEDHPCKQSTEEVLQHQKEEIKANPPELSERLATKIKSWGDALANLLWIKWECDMIPCDQFEDSWADLQDLRGCDDAAAVAEAGAQELCENLVGEKLREELKNDLNNWDSFEQMGDTIQAAQNGPEDCFDLERVNQDMERIRRMDDPEERRQKKRAYFMPAEMEARRRGWSLERQDLERGGARFAELEAKFAEYRKRTRARKSRTSKADRPASDASLERLQSNGCECPTDFPICKEDGWCHDDSDGYCTNQDQRWSLDGCNGWCYDDDGTTAEYCQSGGCGAYGGARCGGDAVIEEVKDTIEMFCVTFGVSLGVVIFGGATSNYEVGFCFGRSGMTFIQTAGTSYVIALEVSIVAASLYASMTFLYDKDELQGWGVASAVSVSVGLPGIDVDVGAGGFWEYPTPDGWCPSRIADDPMGAVAATLENSDGAGLLAWGIQLSVGVGLGLDLLPFGVSQEAGLSYTWCATLPGGSNPSRPCNCLLAPKCARSEPEPPREVSQWFEFGPPRCTDDPNYGKKFAIAVYKKLDGTTRLVPMFQSDEISNILSATFGVSEYCQQGTNGWQSSFACWSRGWAFHGFWNDDTKVYEPDPGDDAVDWDATYDDGSAIIDLDWYPRPRYISRNCRADGSSSRAPGEDSGPWGTAPAGYWRDAGTGEGERWYPSQELCRMWKNLWGIYVTQGELMTKEYVQGDHEGLPKYVSRWERVYEDGRARRGNQLWASSGRANYWESPTAAIRWPPELAENPLAYFAKATEADVWDGRDDPPPEASYTDLPDSEKAFMAAVVLQELLFEPVYSGFGGYVHGFKDCEAYRNTRCGDNHDAGSFGLAYRLHSCPKSCTDGEPVFDPSDESCPLDDAPRRCSDDATFTDKLGYTCADWTGYYCLTHYKGWHSSAYELWRSCPMSCLDGVPQNCDELSDSLYGKGLERKAGVTKVPLARLTARVSPAHRRLNSARALRAASATRRTRKGPPTLERARPRRRLHAAQETTANMPAARSRQQSFKQHRRSLITTQKLGDLEARVEKVEGELERMLDEASA